MKFQNLLLIKVATLIIFLIPIQVLAKDKRACELRGSYGYSYNGTSYSSSTPVPLAETGFYNVDEHGITSEGVLALQFLDFGGNGPLWLLINEVRSNGIVTPDPNIKCSGTINFVSTGTVLKSPKFSSII